MNLPSLSELKPLMDKIEQTDWLIDQVVYKLYGLSVEGTVECFGHCSAMVHKDP